MRLRVDQLVGIDAKYSSISHPLIILELFSIDLIINTSSVFTAQNDKGLNMTECQDLPCSPALTSLHFAPEQPHHFVHLISSLLSPSECTSVTATHTNLVPSNVTPSTVRSREIFTNDTLAHTLWARIKGFYDGTKDTDVKGVGRIVDEDGEAWVITGLNECFRLCLYEKGL
jgi:hypothetical protein